MKLIIALAVAVATLGGCVVVPLDEGYRGDRRGYERGDGYYRGDGYNRSSYDREYQYHDHG